MKTKTSCLLALSCSWMPAMASFHNIFTDVKWSANLLLEWDRANVTDSPLAIHARVFNRTSENEVNTVEADIATGLAENSFLWEDLPYPLPFLSTATYQLQILRSWQAEDTTSELVLASSPPFTIAPQEENSNNDSQSGINGTADGSSPEPDDPPHSDGRPDSNTAIAAGLVVPFVVGVSVFVFLRMERRRKKIREEQRKAREGLVID